MPLQPGSLPHPRKQLKQPAAGLRRGGSKPHEAGRRAEHHFAKRYDAPDGPTNENGRPLVHFRRQPGSGAFVGLKGDVLGDLVKLRILFEVKSWNKVNARGEKTVTFPFSFLEKLDDEAKQLDRIPIFIWHQKQSEEEWAVIRYSWLHEKLREYEMAIYQLEMQNTELLALLPDDVVQSSV